MSEIIETYEVELDNGYKISKPDGERWAITKQGIFWDITEDENLPHQDHVEMSGHKVSVIVRYRVDNDRRLTLTCDLIWPTLRTKEGEVRAYLTRTYDLLAVPFLVNGKVWIPGPVSSIFFNGNLTIVFDNAENDVAVLLSIGEQELEVLFSFSSENKGQITELVEKTVERASGVYGTYRIITDWKKTTPHSTAIQGMIGAYRADHPEIEAKAAHNTVSLPRVGFLKRMREQTVRLETPDEALNVAFDFAKIRAAESLFDTQMGLVHSPGGGRYYGGIWNNDQCEYSGPFFGYLGDADAQTAALTAYRNFAPYMTGDYLPIPSSLEMEGTIPFHAGGDRGDAAMYASGAARFALSVGDVALAEELYTPIAWCLEYCRRKTNADGVVESDCDELEHRFPAGDANLSTACLYYDGLCRTAALARSLSRFEDADDYDRLAKALAESIETHFGATVEGFTTYRYYDGNETLRAWICLPLVFLPPPAASSETTMPSRVAGTLNALFSPRLWGIDGLATESGKPDFWDRSTLYALRGAFIAGDTERAWEHFSAYTRRRLLGEHVPYPVEAYPEGGQAHLSAESALYCRVVVEGMFGLVPTGLRSFQLTPRLPRAWNNMALRRLTAFGTTFDIEVQRTTPDTLTVTVTDTEGVSLHHITIQTNATAEITFT